MTKKIGLVLIAISLGGGPSAHAFKWSKCKNVYKPWPITESKSKNIGNIFVEYFAQLTSQATSQSSTSTTSYVSSTGDCKAFAKAEEERHMYIAETMTELKMESAEGQGEHVTSLATLYGCDQSVQTQFIEMLKENHGQIFSNVSSENSLAIKDRITDHLSRSKVLTHSCNLERI
ncbi:MAG: DUF3015 domain-containing protein [Bdellovibrionales bacterium]|nr:DUF3015 domain-containing protein [Bdellovibrionales bacterium]